MSGHQPVSALKGIGEKTGKLFEKLGVITIDDSFPIIRERMTPMKNRFPLDS